MKLKTVLSRGQIILFLLVFPLISCTARINGSLAADGSASLQINMSLEQGITALIQRMFSAGGQQGPLLDGPSISSSLSQAPGISSAVFRNTSPSAIEGQVRISRVNDFLAIAGFITFEQTRNGGLCRLTINRENGPVMLEFLSSDISDYLNALMAPIATGEKLDKEEYLQVVSAFYNKAIGDEIASSRIRATIDFPGVITGIKGGTFSGRRANFDIPLIDILVLETPLSYEVIWSSN
ncbi:MAG: hypothetical protein FWD26_06590 [Treponema sp.]|nr:hypothetical protein [Treponema sp.]